MLGGFTLRTPSMINKIDKKDFILITVLFSRQHIPFLISISVSISLSHCLCSFCVVSAASHEYTCIHGTYMYFNLSILYTLCTNYGIAFSYIWVIHVILYCTGHLFLQNYLLLTQHKSLDQNMFIEYAVRLSGLNRKYSMTQSSVIRNNKQSKQ